MKKLNQLAILFAATIFISCGADGSKSDKKTTENDSIQTDTDTTISEELKDQVVKLVYIEDYASLDTYEKAASYFGSENMKADTSWYAEGQEMSLSSRCKDPFNSNLIQLVWQEGGKEKLAHIEIDYQVYDKDFTKIQRTQIVESKSGLFTGMTLQELVKFNGEDFEFSGFGWDYAGGVMAPETSKIKKSGVIIRLDLDYNNIKLGENDLMGDMVFKTNSEVVKGKKIFVYEMTYYLN